jgi:predicted Fe-Mo cluster-binding NifX family protein
MKRIAIPTEGVSVSEHFGRCPNFTIVDIDEGSVVRRESITNPEHQPGMLPSFLKGKGVACVIARGMGNRATHLFAQAGIETIVGVSGPVDGVVRQYLEGSLEGTGTPCPGEGHDHAGGGCEQEERRGS